MFCIDDLVPENHLLRVIGKAIDWTFIYDLVEDRYSPDFGRSSMDQVMLIKIPFIQYLYGIRSMRQTIREIEVNVAYPSGQSRMIKSSPALIVQFCSQ